MSDRITPGTQNEVLNLAHEAGWKVEDRGSELRLQPKDGRAISIAKAFTEIPGASRRMDSVKVNRIGIDRRFQRILDERWVAHLAENWNFGAAGVLVLSERPDGSLVALDGQHRREGVLRFGGDAELDCLIYSGLTLAQEAGLFDKLNARLNVHPITRHHARLLAREPTEVAIEAILNQYGTKTAWQTSQGYPCVVALLKIYSSGSEVLRDVIEILEASWPQDHIRHSPIVVSGMAQFHKQVTDLDIDRLIKKLESQPLRPLLTAAKSEAHGSGKSAYWWLARRFEQIYNKGRHRS